MGGPGGQAEGPSAGAVDRAPMRGAVRLYQVARMRQTHALMLRSPVFGPLCDFFLEDLYLSREAGAAGVQAFASMAAVLKRILPAWIRDGARGVVSLHSLSELMDDRLARVLLSSGAALDFKTAEFEASYFACNDRADRLRQIALAEASATFAFELSRHPSVGRLLALARSLRGLPRAAKVLEILERGYHVFRGADSILPLIADMRAGETAYVEGIYSQFSSPPGAAGAPAGVLGDAIVSRAK